MVPFLAPVPFHILALLAKNIPDMITRRHVPVFIPHRMNLSMHRYLTSSGELRLVDVSRRRLMLTAGMVSESFNKFIDNTELLLTSTMGLPHSLVIANSRLEGLAEQAQDNAKGLNEILKNLKVK